MTDVQRKNPAPVPLRAVLLGLGGRAEVLAEAQRLRAVVEQYARIVASDFTGSDFTGSDFTGSDFTGSDFTGSDFTGSEDLSQQDADLAIVFGGDGSILRAAHQMGQRQLPVIAVNLGKLGFLADLLPAELPDVLRDFCDGKLPVVEHLMFECRVVRDGKTFAEQLGLNEVTVQNGPPFAIMGVDLYVDSELVTTYSCDGLIVSTPVGSTAHSLSAGGPILRKNLQAFVVLPISPHTLTNRPVVDSADRVYEMVVAKPSDQTSVVVDGRVLCQLRPGDRVRVEKAAASFKLVTAPGHSYYRTLREKLGWGGRLQLNDGS